MATGVVREVGGVREVVREVGGVAVSRLGRAAAAGRAVVAGKVAAAGRVAVRQVGMCHLLAPLPSPHLAVVAIARPAATSSTATAPVGRSAASRTRVGYGWRC